MGAICNILESKVARRSTLRNPAQWLVDLFTGGEDSATGLNINKNTALKYTPFWSAIRIISGTCGCLPFITYRRLKNGGKERLPEHPVYKLLHDRPNDYMDSLTFIESLQAHVLTYGNGYAEIQRNGAGRPVALWPLLPNKTQRKMTEDYVPYYEVQTAKNETVPLPDYNVLHIKGLGFDGYTGYDVVTYHKKAIAYGVAVKEYGARFFGQGANADGVFEHPETITKEAHDRLKESLKSEYTGLKQSHRTMILEEGMKFNKIGVDPEKAQALEIQKWTVDDCARIFQMPPHMLGSMEFSKFNNVEHLELEFLKRTMLYWFRKWESECNYKLFMPSERGGIFAEILYEALLRGDIKTRYLCYNIGRQAGILCVDDIRKLENLNPLPDGKGQIFLEPLNMVPAGSQRSDGLLKSYEVRAAHKSLILSQWIRIIKKQNGDLLKDRSNAATILTEPVMAFASILRKKEQSRQILQELIEEIINNETKLTVYDADRLADLTMQRIGGENYA